MGYADYSYYTTEFLGNTVPEEDFPRMAERASEYVDYITQGRAANNADLPSVKKSVCALAELYLSSEQAAKDAAAAGASAEGGALASEIVGSWSQSYHSRAELSKLAMEISTQSSQQLYSVAARYLAHTGLLYRGGCCL